ncbi:Nuclear factor NF-kappa-B subunit [Trichinella britovi]|uniref:Nuclear factor NF-kappa-B subunit n=1 Tax=Trichinella britovi TaxID=45882 RepID=A0A0V1D367_TRIBR|nr:Nuclear factor NF-kappa-B subunit [Trichinella britovi]
MLSEEARLKIIQQPKKFCRFLAGRNNNNNNVRQIRSTEDDLVEIIVQGENLQRDALLFVKLCTDDDQTVTTYEMNMLISGKVQSEAVLKIMPSEIVSFKFGVVIKLPEDEVDGNESENSSATGKKYNYYNTDSINHKIYSVRVKLWAQFSSGDGEVAETASVFTNSIYNKDCIKEDCLLNHSNRHFSGDVLDLTNALKEFAMTSEAEPFVYACLPLLRYTDEFGNTLLHLAVRNRQPFALRVVLKVLNDSPDKANILNHKNFRKQTALHLAVRSGESDCVHYLMAAGANRSLVDGNGCTVAHYLSSTFNEDIYRDILFPPTNSEASKYELDLNALNSSGLSAIHIAVAKKKLCLVEALIEAGASVQQQTAESDISLIHEAVKLNDIDMMKLLLKAGSCLEEKNSSGQTALQFALELNHQEAAETLQSYAQESAPDSSKISDHAECSRSLITDVVGVDRVYADDSIANVDYVTRLRLSQRLDRDERWKKLAMQINCSHMVEFIDVCYAVDQTSPTMLLLDQYEQMEAASLGRLVEALGQINFPELATILIENAHPNDHHQRHLITRHNEKTKKKTGKTVHRHLGEKQAKQHLLRLQKHLFALANLKRQKNIIIQPTVGEIPIFRLAVCNGTTEFFETKRQQTVTVSTTNTAIRIAQIVFVTTLGQFRQQKSWNCYTVTSAAVSHRWLSRVVFHQA